MTPNEQMQDYFLTKLQDLYEELIAADLYDTASAINMAEDTLMKEFENE